MNILVDATPLLLRSAGVKTHTWHWLRALRRNAGAHCISAFPLLSEVGPLDHVRSAAGALATWPRLGMLGFLNLPGNPAIDLLTRRADVFHASNMVRNAPSNVTLTATLHDVTSAIMPEYHTAANVRADQYFAERILSRARRVIAVSESTKRDAVRLLRLNADRIAVIYPGIDERFFRAVPAPASKPYVLFVGTIEPRKNIDGLLDAWNQLAVDIREGYDLVIAGPKGWGSEATVARLGSTVGVRYLGYVDEADLPGLTAGATAFVYPSLYEGFGHPPAQAMAAGVPTITSNVSSLPEVAGDATVLIDPKSPSELAAALARVLTSATFRAELALRSRQQAARFRWDECARASLRLFETAAG